MLCNESLQLGHQCLGFCGCGGGMADGAELGKDTHQRITGRLHLRRGLACGFLLKFLVSVGLAPLFFCLCGVFVDFPVVKGCKVHNGHSCHLNFPGMGNECVQVLPLKLQQVDLLLQSFLLVESGGVENLPDFLQRELQLPEEQNGLQTPQGCIVIQPIACLCHPGGFQQTDGIVVVERAHTHAGDAADFFYSFHIISSRQEGL